MKETGKHRGVWQQRLKGPGIHSGTLIVDCMGILYGSTPTIISLRLESGGQRGPRALTATQCKVLCPESLCGPTPITGIMSLVHLELWDFSRIPRATIARGILLSPFELSVMQLRVLFLSRCLFESFGGCSGKYGDVSQAFLGNFSRNANGASTAGMSASSMLFFVLFHLSCPVRDPA